MNILDHFEKNPLPWYDQFVETIQNIPVRYKVGVSFLMTIIINLVVSYKVIRIELEDFFFIEICIAIFVGGLGGVIQWTALIIGFLLKKITGQYNLLDEVDFLSAFFLAAVIGFVVVICLALSFAVLPYKIFTLN